MSEFKSDIEFYSDQSMVSKDKKDFVVEVEARD